MPRKRRIPLHLRGELKGFEDILDMIDPQKEGMLNPREDLHPKSYEVQNFLEHDLLRLKKLLHFLEAQIHTIKNTPHLETLIVQQEILRNKYQYQLAKHLGNKDHKFEQNLVQLYAHIFKANEKT